MVTQAQATIFEHKGKDWFQINEMEISLEDVLTILGDPGLGGYTKQVAIHRLVKAMEVALDSEQRALIQKVRGE